MKYSESFYRDLLASCKKSNIKFDKLYLVDKITINNEDLPVIYVLENSSDSVYAKLDNIIEYFKSDRSIPEEYCCMLDIELSDYKVEEELTWDMLNAMDFSKTTEYIEKQLFEHKTNDELHFIHRINLFYNLLQIYSNSRNVIFLLQGRGDLALKIIRLLEFRDYYVTCYGSSTYHECRSKLVSYKEFDNIVDEVITKERGNKNGILK